MESNSEMKTPPTITVIGAASTTFGPKVLRDLVNHPELDGATIHLVDVNPERLDIQTRLTKRVCEEAGRTYRITSHTDRKTALPGSDFVLISIDIRHYELWQQDFSIPVRHGIRQVTGELGGPGGLFHSLRQIPLHLEVARDVENHCPNARVMVMSNPLNRICQAMRQHSQVGEIFGLCHGVEITHEFVFSKILGLAGEEISSTAAGTNHFTWILKLWHNTTGEDLYPALREKIDSWEPERERLSRKLFSVFGYYPACGDAHLGEYIPYAWEYLGLQGPPFDLMRQNESQYWEKLDRLSRGEGDRNALQPYLGPRQWVDTLAFPIISALTTGKPHRMPAVNMLNHGTIENLPGNVFVESPAWIEGNGVQPETIGTLPPALAAFNRRDIEQMEATVEAAVTGDRRILLQALLLDPVVDSVNAAEGILEEMLCTQKDYLPQFAE